MLVLVVSVHWGDRICQIRVPYNLVLCDNLKDDGVMLESSTKL